MNPVYPLREARVGKYLAIYGLAITLILVGSLKLLAPEGIEMLVSNSPLLSWVYDIWSVQTFGYILGSVEILAGLAIALRPVLPRLAAAGAVFAIVLFLYTVSFLFTTPGVYDPVGLLSPMPGQFLAKDLLFLAVAIFTLQDSLLASREPPRLMRREETMARERIAP